MMKLARLADVPVGSVLPNAETHRRLLHHPGEAGDDVHYIKLELLGVQDLS